LSEKEGKFECRHYAHPVDGYTTGFGTCEDKMPKASEAKRGFVMEHDGRVRAVRGTAELMGRA